MHLPAFRLRGTTYGGVRRDHWARRNAALDPETDFVEISRNLSMHEMPWDMNQALSFALFRTYAVPGIGRLLDATGEFTGRVQKRYDDTALLLEQPVEHGFDHPQARTAIRRVNAMHRAYDIPDHELAYVLATFVVVPKRWFDDYGKRSLSDAEVRASVRYYQELGRRMGIKQVPDDYAGFERLLDSYEAEHFAFDEGARRVADATMALMLTFYPPLARPVMAVASRALMDEPLLVAFRYHAAPRPVVALVRAGLRLRGRLLRFFPARMTPKHVADLPWVRSYPKGFRVADLGTFPVPGVGACPVRHESVG